MSYIAVFIGGAFDMTKREMNDKVSEVYFYEPIEENYSIEQYNRDRIMECRNLIYRLSYITEKGVLVYEYVETKDSIKQRKAERT